VAENSFQNLGQFSIRVRIGNAEIEISAPDKSFVLNESNRLIEQFKLDAMTPRTTQVEVIQGEATAIPEQTQTRFTKPETLGEFFRRINGLQTHLDKILAFGYWCEIKQHKQHFTAEDVLSRYKEAKETPPANIRRDLSSLVSKGLLLPPGKTDDGTLTYALSNSGIKEVESKIQPE
jgi:hypothetical protein